MLKTTIYHLDKSGILTFLFCLLFLQFISAQDQMKHWYMDGKSIDFTSSVPVVSDVESQGLVSNIAYNGFYNAEGELLFHWNKGQVTNRFGDFIGYTSEGSDFPGTENAVLPINGECGKFLLFWLEMSPTSNDVAVRVKYSELDLELNDGVGGFTAGLENILIVEDTDASLEGIGSIALSPKNSSGEHFLYSAFGTYRNIAFGEYIYGKVFSTKIDAFGTVEPSIEIATSLIEGNETEYEHAFTNPETELSSDGTMLAFGNIKPDSGSPLDATIIHLNPETGTLNTSLGIAGRTTLDIVSGNGAQFTGIEFTEDNTGLFITEKDVGIWHVDITDLSNPVMLLVGNSSDYAQSQIERAFNGEYYVAFDDSTLGRIVFNQAMNVYTVLNDQITELEGAISLNESWLGISSYSLYLLPDQIDGYDYDETFTQAPAGCCTYSVTLNAGTHEVNGNATWTVNDNPFDNANVIRIGTELRVKSGTELTIDNIDVEFGIDAKVIIEKGATLNVNNSTLRPYECNDDSAWWRGIEVRGDASLTQTGTNQGRLNINNSRIEHAKEAVKLHQSGAGTAGTGGIINATGTTFYNNKRSSEFIKYSNGTGSNHQANLSYYHSCTFTVDDNYRSPDGKSFEAHVTMWRVDGVNFRGCTFENNKTLNTLSDGRYALYTWNADFNVTPFLLQRSSFHGFWRAIEAYSSSCGDNFTNHIISKADFTGNFWSIYNKGVCDARVTQCTFEIGQFDFNIPFYYTRVGLRIDKGTRYIVEQNEFTSNVAGTQIRTIGVYLRDTGPESNQIYNNDFTDLGIGSNASGNNRENPDVNDGYSGLRFFCNENSGNSRDIVVSGIIDETDGIGTNQGVMSSGPTGDALKSANNTFSHISRDLQNPSSQNPVIYWAVPGEDVPTLIENTYVTLDAQQGNECIDYYHFQSPPDDRKLSSAQKSSYYSELEINGADYLAKKSLMKSRIDEDDTDNLKGDVETTNDAADLRTKLLEVSPYVSKKVLEKTVERSDLLSDAVRYEILSANPDEVKKEELLQFTESLSEPLPDYMVDWLVYDANSTTARTLLNAKAEGHHAAMSNAAIHLIHDEMVEEGNANHAEVRNLLNTMGGLNAEFSIVDSHIAEGNYSAATSILNAIPSTINLSGDYLDDYSQFKSLKELEINVLNSGRDWSLLNSSEISQLQSIADSDEGMGAGQAQGIMNFFYDGQYAEEPTWPSTGNQRIGVRRTPDRDKLNAEVVSIFPNPVKDLLICQYILPEGKESALLTIRNGFGEAVKVFDIKRSEGQITYDTRGLTSGLYFYTMRVDGFEEMTGEFIVVK